MCVTFSKWSKHKVKLVCPNVKVCVVEKSLIQAVTLWEVGIHKVKPPAWCRYTQLYFYLCEAFPWHNALPDSLPLNLDLILTSTLKPRLKPQRNLWRCDDQPKSPHFPRNSLCSKKENTQTHRHTHPSLRLIYSVWSTSCANLKPLFKLTTALMPAKCQGFKCDINSKMLGRQV